MKILAKLKKAAEAVKAIESIDAADVEEFISASVDHASQAAATLVQNAAKQLLGTKPAEPRDVPDPSSQSAPEQRPKALLPKETKTKRKR